MAFLDIATGDKRFFQRLLRAGGYYTGKIDGIVGPQTRSASARFCADADAIKQAFGEFDERSEGNISTLLPDAQVLARVWLTEAQKKIDKKYSIKIICGTRTYAEQHQLFLKRPRVTKADSGYSWHNFGLAFDFGIFSADGKKYYGESEQYVKMGELAPENITSFVTKKAIPATWGGSWKSFKDYPHIQLDLYKSTAAARAAFEA